MLPALTGRLPGEALGEIGLGQVGGVDDVAAALLEGMHHAPLGTTPDVVMFGTAIGAASVAHGEPLLGTGGRAGEPGYLPCGRDGAIQRLEQIVGVAEGRRSRAARKARAPATAARWP
ncbi:MAG: hypothetical protein JO090_11095 [Rhizobacter sp.]|nr:hypothetical protein [Rhizobacter sp.]